MTSPAPWILRVLLLALVLFARAPLVHAQQTIPSALSRDRVTFFTEPGFQGDSIVIEAGASVQNLDTIQRNNGRPWALAIASVRVEGAARAVVHSAANFRGDRLEITRSIPDLHGERRGSARWDRAIASIVVIGPQQVIVAAPNRPPTVVVAPPPAVVVEEPPRPRYSYREAEGIVRHAYREVLDRPVDPEGLRTNRERLMRQGWTEEQLIQSLQRSAEARAISADGAITRMYQEVLGHAPDAHGLNHYRQKWRDGWTQGRIRRDLEGSPEARDRKIREAINRSYRELLGRDPDPSGFANFERQMRDKGFTERQLREAILSSEEYRSRNPGGGRGRGRSG